MDIKSASRADLESIALLHKETFKGLFSGELSVPCLIAFYQSLLDNPHGCTFVLQEDNNFAGFISGCASGDYVSFALKMRMVVEALKTYRILDILRLFKKAVYYTRLGITAELISVSVVQKYQRRGFGNCLLGALEKYFIENGVTQYFVFTDLKRSRGLNFYLAKQFEEIKRIKLLGLEGVFLQRTIPS